MSTNGAGPEAIEADIERQREQLAATVDELQYRLDVPARAKDKAAEIKDRATTDTGKPRPELAAAVFVAVAAATAFIIWRRSHTMSKPKKLTLLAAVGAGYVLGARAGRERYEQIAVRGVEGEEEPHGPGRCEQGPGDRGRAGAGRRQRGQGQGDLGRVDRPGQGDRYLRQG